MLTIPVKSVPYFMKMQNADHKQEFNTVLNSLVNLPKQGQLAGKSSRLSLWNDLRARNKSLKLNKPIINYDE